MAREFDDKVFSRMMNRFMSGSDGRREIKECGLEDLAKQMELLEQIRITPEYYGSNQIREYFQKLQTVLAGESDLIVGNDFTERVGGYEEWFRMQFCYDDEGITNAQIILMGIIAAKNTKLDYNKIMDLFKRSEKYNFGRQKDGMLQKSILAQVRPEYEITFNDNIFGRYIIGCKGLFETETHMYCSVRNNLVFYIETDEVRDFLRKKKTIEPLETPSRVLLESEEDYQNCNLRITKNEEIKYLRKPGLMIENTGPNAFVLEIIDTKSYEF